jgi:glycosyltransferase involved in cell wall biosynthesis
LGRSGDIQADRSRVAKAEIIGAMGLVAELETALPELWVSRASAVFVYGSCFDPDREVTSLRVLVDGVAHPVQAHRMPRLDVLERHEGVDGAYRSGFWATVQVPAREGSGEVVVGIEAEFGGGGREEAELGRLTVVAPERAAPTEGGEGADRIAICMATYNPEPALLEAQLDSIRAQTDESWVCVISDDRSDAESFESILSAVGDDPRFVVSRSPTRLGFYRNFERALTLAPADAELLALSDQDDRWYPEKLEVLRGAIGDAGLVYSDMRLVDAGGNHIRETLWRGRRNNHSNLASMLVANSVAGAASLMRREVVEAALPFPDGPGWEFHDHWIGSVALAGWRLAYVDRPLYDYVQHSSAILGQVTGDADRTPVVAHLASSLRPGGVFGRWRSAYFRAYAQTRLLVEVIRARCDARLTPEKRRALRLLADSERSPWAFAWLALRPLRRFGGRDDTLGAETLLARGIMWRWLLQLRVRGRRGPRRLRADASLPALDLEALGQRRMRRWRAGP